MGVLIVAFVIFAFISSLLGWISSKYDSVVKTLVLADGIAVLFFIIYLLFIDDFWFYSIGFACLGIPGTIIGIIISNKKENSSIPNITIEKNEKNPQYLTTTLQGYSLLTGDQEYYIGNKCIGLSPRKGYQKYSIAGVCYRNLPITSIGKFNGYAFAETDNEHDPYAIAIYNDAHTHLGFLPRGNRSLHSYIIKEGKKVHAYGYIGCDSNDNMYGEVCVENNNANITKRNKSYTQEHISRPGDKEHPMYY